MEAEGLQFQLAFTGCRCRENVDLVRNKVKGSQGKRGLAQKERIDVNSKKKMNRIEKQQTYKERERNKENERGSRDGSGGVSNCLEAGVSLTCLRVGKQTSRKRAGAETRGKGE